MPFVESISVGVSPGTGAVSVVVPEPATTTDASVLLTYFTWYGNDAKVITPPSGGLWSVLMRGSGSPDDITIALYWKIRGQGAGPVAGNYVFTCTTNGTDFFSSPDALSIGGANPVTPFPGSASFTKAFGSSASPSTGTAFTVAVANSLALFITTMDNGWNTTPIAGWTNILANSDGSHNVFTKSVSAGSTGSPATTGNLDAWAAFMLAVAPPDSSGLFFGSGTTS